mgnify:CR=1 FL=1
MVNLTTYLCKLGLLVMLPFAITFQAMAVSCDNTTYPLNQGWNLIGFSADPVDTPLEILTTIPGVISLWSYEGGGWNSLHPGQPEIDVHPIVDIEPGKGYWIQMDAETNYQPQGSWLDWDGSYSDLVKGWNLLALDQESDPHAFSTQRGSKAIWGREGRQQWSSFISDVPIWLNSLQWLRCGQGYYLYADQGNNRPQAQSASFQLDEDSALAGVLQGLDEGPSDTLTFSVSTAPRYGMLTLDSSGSFHYQPQQNYFGNDQFLFVVNDGRHNSVVAKVELTVRPQPDLLWAEDLTITLLANGLVGAAFPGGDPDGGDVIYEVSTAPARGAVSIESGGLFFYTPNSGESGGEDQFIYRVVAGEESVSGSVTIQLSSGESLWDQLSWDQDNWE